MRFAQILALGGALVTMAGATSADGTDNDSLLSRSDMAQRCPRNDVVAQINKCLESTANGNSDDKAAVKKCKKKVCCPIKV